MNSAVANGIAPEMLNDAKANFESLNDYLDNLDKQINKCTILGSIISSKREVLVNRGSNRLSKEAFARLLKQKQQFINDISIKW